MPGCLPAVDVQRLPGDERGLLEIEHPLDDVGNLAHATKGVKHTQVCVGRWIVRGCLDDAERDRVDRSPRDAYSMASERVTATSPPLVRAGSAEGLVLSA